MNCSPNHPLNTDHLQAALARSLRASRSGGRLRGTRMTTFLQSATE